MCALAQRVLAVQTALTIAFLASKHRHQTQSLRSGWSISDCGVPPDSEAKPIENCTLVPQQTGARTSFPASSRTLALMTNSLTDSLRDLLLQHAAPEAGLVVVCVHRAIDAGETSTVIIALARAAAQVATDICATWIQLRCENRISTFPQRRITRPPVVSRFVGWHAEAPIAKSFGTSGVINASDRLRCTCHCRFSCGCAGW